MRTKQVQLMLKMKKLFKYFYTESDSFKAELGPQRAAFLFVSTVFAFTSILLWIPVLKRWKFGTISKDPNLGILIVMNSIGYFIVSIIAFNFAGKIQKAISVEDLFKLKKTFLNTYLMFIGLPTIGLVVWAYLEKDIPTSLTIFCFLITAVSGMFYFDWKDYKKLKAKWGMGL